MVLLYGGLAWGTRRQHVQPQWSTEETYTNNKPHTHESKPGILTNVLITKKIIETAKADIFASAPTVVEKILEEDADQKNPQNIPDQTTTT
jgi:hypothetical protein